ncbi:hypothetical protein MAXJ12_26638 [Mesorhizobium alhagi CCNWXJ12-2]|uniref:Uncharacterized protein n=2 Tax=Allomesorhizobium alhagi TaxID=475067 RepID=H0HYP7_9HYPH|nr:hypothetical protein MAXJ12_26638 [Mesorhizobium alhagi CCNWXJ12-2]
MRFEDEKPTLPARTNFTPSVLKDFCCDLETDCRCRPDMRPTCEYNVKARPAPNSVIYQHNLKFKVAKKAGAVKKPSMLHEVNSSLAVGLLLVLLVIAGAGATVAWHFGEWIRSSIQ